MPQKQKNLHFKLLKSSKDSARSGLSPHVEVEVNLLILMKIFDLPLVFINQR